MIEESKKILESIRGEQRLENSFIGLLSCCKNRNRTQGFRTMTRYPSKNWKSDMICVCFLKIFKIDFCPGKDQKSDSL